MSRRLALVTGGLDRVGAAIAARLAAAGWALALHCRETCAPAPVLSEAIARYDTPWQVVQADLADPAAAAGLLDRVTQACGAVPAALVNSASTIAEGEWASVSAEAMLAHWQVNALAPVLLVRALAAALPAGGTAAVVNILDQRVANPPVDQAGYTASKLALDSYTRVLARAFAPHLRVNAVAPGLTIPGDDYLPGQVERLAAGMPLARLPTPADVAEAVAYLIEAQSVTGQTIAVDGGAALESFPRDFVHMARGPDRDP